MKPTLVLDVRGDNPIPPGYEVVRDDRAFLHLVRTNNSAVVQGEHLCRWAAEVGKARGWKCVWRSSPATELLHGVPSLTSAQATAILDRAGRAVTLSRPVSLRQVVFALWPELDPAGKTDFEHAFTWLLWRFRTPLLPEEQSLVTAVARSFLWSDQQPLTQITDISEQAACLPLIRAWLRVDSSDLAWPEPPSEPPGDLLQVFTVEWRRIVIADGGIFFSDLLARAASRVILMAAASVVFEYLRQNPGSITSDRLSEIKPYLRSTQWQDLERCRPVQAPAPLPSDLAGVSRWFVGQYLPYRLGNSGIQQDKASLQKLGRDFGEWYLRVYADSRAGGAEGKALSWNRKAKLNEDTSSVKLLIVLDGLGYLDGLNIVSFVASESKRLTTEEVSVAMAPIPTITDFAKDALRAGVNPALAFEEELDKPETKDSDVLSALSRARAGDLVIWSLLEPDWTYHKPMSPEVLRFEVEARLLAIARRIVRVAHGVTDAQPLRIVITTDHGRLLSPSARSHSVPSGMSAHGRAAWGASSVTFNSDGLFYDDGVVYLHPDRFGLPFAAAMVIDDDAFLTADGKRGIETSTHGGVFPEEVLIPWIEMRRDRGPVDLGISVIGRGVAGTQGTVKVHVVNRSEVRICAIQLQFPSLGAIIRMNAEILPWSEGRFEFPLGNWPQRSQLPNLKGDLVYAMPAGQVVKKTVSADLSTDEMYSRDSILEDLL